MATIACVVLVIHAAVIFAGRSIEFMHNPPVPLERTARLGGAGFNSLADTLALPEASILTPDLGGVLLDSKLRVFDLAGLCDPVIARNLSISGDVSRLHDYVFAELKPTFIHTAGTFQRIARLHQDSRFAADYVPLYESWDGPATWSAVWGGTPPPWWGDYVRRDAAPSELALDRLRTAHRRADLQANGPWVRLAAPLSESWPQISRALSLLRTEFSMDALPAASPAR
jgi:hypothetical protein